MKILITAVIIVAVGFLLFTLVTSAPKKALADCYSQSNNKLQEIMQKYSANSAEGRKICNDAFNEANTMRQCVNNVYAKYGQTQTALARRSLNMNNTNPVDNAIKKHNQDCNAYPETTIK